MEEKTFRYKPAYIFGVVIIELVIYGIFLTAIILSKTNLFEMPNRFFLFAFDVFVIYLLIKSINRVQAILRAFAVGAVIWITSWMGEFNNKLSVFIFMGLLFCLIIFDLVKRMRYTSVRMNNDEIIVDKGFGVDESRISIDEIREIHFPKDDPNYCVLKLKGYGIREIPLTHIKTKERETIKEALCRVAEERGLVFQGS